MLLVACPIVAAKLGEAILSEEKNMFIEGTKHTKVNVEISTKQLCNAVEQCDKITLVKLVGMLANKMNAGLKFNYRMYIEDGWWYLSRVDHFDDPMRPLKKHKASEAEIAVYDAIEKLVAVLVFNKLKK